MKLDYRFNEWREGPPWKYDGDVTVLPPAGREAMLEKDPPVSARSIRESQGPEMPGLETLGLLPGGDHRVPGADGEEIAATASNDSIRRASKASPVVADLLNHNGWSVASIKGGDQDGGITSHRGVLAPGEYVSERELQQAIEAELGYTYEQIRSVYRQGPITGAKRELRDVIDARMLALRRSGANLAVLGRAIGFTINLSGNCRTLDNAVSRARAVEQWKENLR